MLCNYKIIYEDDELLIVDKPQGLPTTFGKNKNSLIELVFNDFSYLKNVKGYNNKEGGLLNRLDNDTGGLVLFAKNDVAFNYYKEQMKNSKIKKIYTSIVKGILKNRNGIISLPIIHHPKSKKKMKVIFKKSKNIKYLKAETHYEVIKEFDNYSILKVIIYKGVRHQIRIHLASIGYPIVGDKIYGDKNSSFKYHLLYANGLQFINLNNKEVFVNIDPNFSNLEIDKIK